jgi:hypothetical protein
MLQRSREAFDRIVVRATVSFPAASRSMSWRRRKKFIVRLRVEVRERFVCAPPRWNSRCPFGNRFRVSGSSGLGALAELRWFTHTVQTSMPFNILKPGTRFHFGSKQAARAEDAAAAADGRPVERVRSNVIPGLPLPIHKSLPASVANRNATVGAIDTTAGTSALTSLPPELFSEIAIHLFKDRPATAAQRDLHSFAQMNRQVRRALLSDQYLASVHLRTTRLMHIVRRMPIDAFIQDEATHILLPLLSRAQRSRLFKSIANITDVEDNLRGIRAAANALAQATDEESVGLRYVLLHRHIDRYSVPRYLVRAIAHVAPSVAHATGRDGTTQRRELALYATHVRLRGEDLAVAIAGAATALTYTTDHERAELIDILAGALDRLTTDSTLATAVEGLGPTLTRRTDEPSIRLSCRLTRLALSMSRGNPRARAMVALAPTLAHATDEARLELRGHFVPPEGSTFESLDERLELLAASQALAHAVDARGAEERQRLVDRILCCEGEPVRASAIAIVAMALSNVPDPNAAKQCEQLASAVLTMSDEASVAVGIRHVGPSLVHGEGTQRDAQRKAFAKRALSMNEPRSRVFALIGAAAALSQAKDTDGLRLRDRLFEDIANIEDENLRAQAIAGMAPSLAHAADAGAAELRHRVIQQSKSVEGMEPRSVALAGAASALPHAPEWDTQFDDLLAEVMALGEEQFVAGAIAKIAALAS